MPYLLAGPFVALVGIVAVFFVLRRKSVEKRSMYSARRSQIEHKVRAARQRTLTPRSRGARPAEETIPGASGVGAPQAEPTMVYQVPAYEAPPAAPVTSPFEAEQAPAAAPWDTPAAAPGAPAAPPAFDYPAAEPAYTPPAPEPATFRPAPEPTPMAQPSEPAWTPAPAPAEPAVAEAVAAGAPAASAGGWSVVTTDKEPAEVSADGKRKDNGGASGSWSLASGDNPGLVDDGEPQPRRPSGTVMAVAQYAVLVVGLVMVLIGVLVMVANAHVT